MAESAKDAGYGDPPFRRLQIFSLDPAADVKLETALISRAVLKVAWETLEPGPVGEYVEVVDFDPSSKCAYDPVDLDRLLGTDGLEPSTGNPQFHQQMVYAVAMQTIMNFERALGRKILWSERDKDETGGYISESSRRYVPRLRIYPHAIREQNAYYSPAKKALLFGYFNAPTADPRDELPGGMVFTCLSHDITAHETTHAILDGIHRRLLDASNSDMLAFHEAFADIVAIFQHFTVPGLLLDQIQKTRGDLTQDSLLAQLASQFARSTGNGNALRNALGSFGTDGRRESPDPSAIGRTFEPHARGAILVAAVFDAFLRMYENRVADLRRIATQGTGVLPAGEIHPDLARRFADEAVKAAGRVLTICIRAVDFLPPVDISFGDYFRALITADAEAAPDDPKHYRLAFIEAFRDRGIYPLDVRALAEDALLWRKSTEKEQGGFREYLPPANVLRTMAYAYGACPELVDGFEACKQATLQCFKEGDLDGAAKAFLDAAWLPANRHDTQHAEGEKRRNRFLLDKIFAGFLHRWIMGRAKLEKRSGYEELKGVESYLGLDIDALRDGTGRLEVHSVRPKIGVGPNGRSTPELLVILTQKRYEPLYDENGNPLKDASGDELTFRYRGGCTLIIDPAAARVRYAISKNLSSDRRKERQAKFLRDQVAHLEEDAVERFGLTLAAARTHSQFEPFAMVHGGATDDGGY